MDGLLRLNLPTLLFGPGARAMLPEAIEALGCASPLLISDRVIEGAGLLSGLSGFAAQFLDIAENPAAAAANGAAAAYRSGNCDCIVALGGGSVIDTAKITAAMVESGCLDAAELIGHPDRIAAVAPLIAIPTTVGTGSECSPVAALHLVPGGPGIGTRSPLLVPQFAICDPDLVRSLPARLVTATAVDAMSHCIEAFFGEPPHAVIDALALDGAARVFQDVGAALNPAGDDARASLMAAAFAGGVAIHKGLGPAHALALACADQDVHHGTLIAIALPHTTQLLADHLPVKGQRLANAMNLQRGAEVGDALGNLIASLGLPSTLAAAGYRIDDLDRLADEAARSHFNRTSPYVPKRQEYRQLLQDIAG